MSTQLTLLDGFPDDNKRKEKRYAIEVTTLGTKGQLEKLLQSLTDLHAIKEYSVTPIVAKMEKPKDLDNVVCYPLTSTVETLYNEYPRKQGKTEGVKNCIAYLNKGRQITGYPNKVQLNHHQLSLAIREYARVCEKEQKEKQFIQMFSTFMNSKVLDYVESTRDIYEQGMQDKYGDGWQKLKFIYK
jgi:hypothetical protein